VPAAPSARQGIVGGHLSGSAPTLPAPTRTVPARGSSSADELLGLELTPETGQAMMVALIVFAAMLLLALLFADQLQLAPRYRALVRSFSRRPRR
jgi:hypothetical protein